MKRVSKTKQAKARKPSTPKLRRTQSRKPAPGRLEKALPERKKHVPVIVAEPELEPVMDEQPTAEAIAAEAAAEQAAAKRRVPAQTEASEPVRAGESLAGDPIRLYMREIGEVALLSAEEELALANRIKRGDTAAREHMIKANLRLVVKIARDYENYGLPLLDLISEGNIGLMKAVERFDPTKGAKLSTYAAWWIKQAIKRALADQGKTIRLPVHVVDKLFHIRKAESRLVELMGREPTDAEIADETGLKADQVRDYRKASVAPTSLDAKLGDDDTNRIGDIVADPNAAAPYQQALEDSDNQILSDVIRTLSPREQAILQLRFGLNGEDEKTLEEVGQQFGVTRERIRQIQDEALRKLRKRIQQRDKKREEYSAAV